MKHTTEKAIMETRAKIAHLGALLFERRLTDAGGGNISALVGEVVCLSPRYSGSKRRWQLQPEDILVVDREGNILAGEGQLSRETQVHLKLYEAFSEVGTAVIHAHARNVMPFAALAQSMPPVLEANLKFGEVKCIDYAPAHSIDLANNVVEALRGQEARIRTQAAGVIAPWHGLFLIGKDLDAAFDAVERFDTNARTILMARLMGMGDRLAEQSEALRQAADAAGKHY